MATRSYMNKVMKSYFQLREMISDQTAVIAVIGLGFVGLSEALAFVLRGFDVVGYDLDGEKIQRLSAGEVPAGTVNSVTWRRALASGKLRLFSDPMATMGAHCYIICVPTPIVADGQVDLSAITSVVENIEKIANPPFLAVLTSTVPPGTTRELVAKPLESAGLAIGRDAFIAFAPERIDPGNTRFNVENTPRFMAGVEEKSCELSVLMYSYMVDDVKVVNSIESAEMAKLVENCFRLTNISLVNELLKVSNSLQVDIWEAIEAAATKPFGFMPFYPGPGAGGSCVPWAPYYLRSLVDGQKLHTPMLDASLEINNQMPDYVSEYIVELAKSRVPGCRRVILIGVAFKPGVDDVRESPAKKIIEYLLRFDFEVQYHDPLVPWIKTSSGVLESQPLLKANLEGAIVVVVTPQPGVDFNIIVEHSAIVIDTRNHIRDGWKGKVVKL